MEETLSGASRSRGLELPGCVEERGLSSALTLNALEAMTSSGPLLAHDVMNWMHMVLSPVQHTLWCSEWMAGLRAEPSPKHPLHGSLLMCLAGMARGWEIPRDKQLGSDQGSL